MPKIGPKVIFSFAGTLHTADDVERCNSYYDLTSADKQHALKHAHHLGCLSFLMNGVVPPPVAVWYEDT